MKDNMTTKKITKQVQDKFAELVDIYDLQPVDAGESLGLTKNESLRLFKKLFSRPVRVMTYNQPKQG